jgi:transcriptional regulator GlxA family with amidase domain
LKEQFEASLIGVVVYEGVEPIDVGGTVGVISMATRILPELRYSVIAERKGAVRLASGLTILADSDFESAASCDTYIVTGGPGWREQVENSAMLDFLARRSPSSLASVCTGALILAALYVLGRLYGSAVRDEIASLIEYDRAFAANREALGHIRSGELRPG